MSDKSSRLPNLYQLLGLQPLEPERAKILAALDAIRHRIPSGAIAPQEKVGNQERVRLQRLVALGEKVLLEPQRKAVYDQEWKSVYASSATSGSSTEAATKTHNKSPQVTASGVTASGVTASGVTVAGVTVPRWDTGRLVELLPAGDPHASFDMAAFLRSAECRDPVSAEADLQTLMGLLGGESIAASTGASTQSFDVQPRLIEALPIDGQPGSSGLTLPRRSGSQALGGHAQRMRRKKQRALIVGGLSFAAAIAGLVLLGVYLSGPSDNESRAPAPLAISNVKPELTSGLPVENSNSGAASRVEAKPAVRGSGLPQPGTTPALDIQSPPLEPSAVDSATAKLDIPVNSETPVSSPTTAPAMASTPPTNPTLGASTPDTTPPSTPSAEPTPANGAVPETSPPEPAAPLPVDETLTRDEKQSWQKGMLTAKESIAKFNFEQAERQLSQLKDAAKTGLQRAQLERLQAVAGFVKDIRQAMIDAIESLEGADTFKIGTSTIASFVEGDESKIIVRVSGERRSFALPDVPVAMGLALVDLKLDVAHANTLARKGAYILLHPKNNAMLQRGKQMLQEAAAAGAISTELAHFYEDDYALSQLPK